MNLTKDHFGNVMSQLSVIYNKEISTELLLIYWDCLKSKFTNEEFTAAMKLHISNPQPSIRNFFPKPGDLLDFVRVDYELEALNEWKKVTEDRYTRAQLNAKATEAMRMLGGMHNFLMSDMQYWPMRQKDFINAYTRLSERQEKQEVFDDTKALQNIHVKVIELKNKQIL